MGALCPGRATTCQRHCAQSMIFYESICKRVQIGPSLKGIFSPRKIGFSIDQRSQWRWKAHCHAMTTGTSREPNDPRWRESNPFHVPSKAMWGYTGILRMGPPQLAKENHCKCCLFFPNFFGCVCQISSFTIEHNKKREALYWFLYVFSIVAYIYVSTIK